MGVDKKYALLDTDFLYKSHVARNAANHTLTDFVMEFTDYEFFCYEMIREMFCIVVCKRLGTIS